MLHFIIHVYADENHAKMDVELKPFINCYPVDSLPTFDQFFILRMLFTPGLTCQIRMAIKFSVISKICLQHKTYSFIGRLLRKQLIFSLYHEINLEQNTHKI